MYDLPTASPPSRRDRAPIALPAATDLAPASRAGMLGRMLDIVPHGMLLVTDDGYVVFANQVARSELDEHHPLQLLGSELRVRRPQDVVPLREALNAASRRGLQRLLTLGDGASATVTVSVAPVGEPGAGDAAGAMVIFGKREVCEDLSAEAYARQCRLTGAETRVLKQLCAGRRPTEIAHEQGVAVSTVRTQIGCIREKTGTPDIGGLLRRVAKLPPLLNQLRLAA